MAVFCAFLCLGFSACNDLLFKLFARKERSRGLFVAVIGAVWLAMVGVTLKGDAIDWPATMFWGAVSGVFSVTGNLLLIESMGRLGAGVCSTIYRLNLVPVVLGASLLLGETLSLLQWIGVGCAIMAVLAFRPKGGVPRPGGKMLTAAFALIILAAFLRAGMGLSYRYGFLHGADRGWVTALNAVCWIAGGLVYARFCEKKGAPLNWKMAGYGALSGCLVVGIVVTMALSLQYGEAAQVLPIAQMSFLLTSILSIWLLKEKFTARFGAALGLGVAAIVCLVV